MLGYMIGFTIFTLIQAGIILACEICGNRREVGVAAPFPYAVYGALNLAAAVPDSSEAVGDGQTGVVMTMDAEPDGQVRFYRFEEFRDPLGQRAAVGVAQHDAVGAGFLGDQEGAEGIIGVRDVAVERVLCVVNYFATGTFAK